MPELPEVETVAKQLNRVLKGKIISRVVGKEFNILGKKVEKVERKQKIIVISLNSNEVVLVHLKMTGQLIYLGKGSDRIAGGHPTKDWVGELPSKYTRVVVEFTDGSQLFFNDQRKFGWVKLMSKADWEIKKTGMAPDVVDDSFTLEYLILTLKKSTRAIKLVILDQNKMGGLGNIYANDALYLAGINPNSPSDQVKRSAVKKLHQAIIEVINRGIETGGASISDYVDTLGVGGHYQDYFLVYDQAGNKCKKCGANIEKIKLGGRGTYFCPDCQR